MGGRQTKEMPPARHVHSVHGGDTFANFSDADPTANFRTSEQEKIRELTERLALAEAMARESQQREQAAKAQREHETEAEVQGKDEEYRKSGQQPNLLKAHFCAPSGMSR